jgi:hypothetical protein
VLLIFLALVWLALLTPVAVRKIREARSDRSIESFHAEHEVLSRQGYSVAPAHRLEQPGESVAASPRRPRLTLVHPEDTYRSLESRATWEEWSEDYDFDHAGEAAVGHYASPARSPERDEAVNRYARAYAARPAEPREEYFGAPLRGRSMRVQRRRVAATLVGGAVLLTLIAYFSSVSLAADLAYVAWVLVVGYAALALFAVSQGYLSTSLFTRPATHRTSAYADEDGAGYYGSAAVVEAGDEQWRDEWDDEWDREPEPVVSYGGRRAFG